ncbi:MAG: cell division protein FtsA [Bacteroidales bacterium]|nr:cell division protein FtsA [Bacteroidales bacterium]
MATKNSNYVAAIDLGTTKVVTLVAQRTKDGKLEIVGLSSTPSQGIVKGAIENLDDTSAAIKKTVAEVEAQTGLKICSVYVGIAGQNIRVFNTYGSVVVESDDNLVHEEHLEQLKREMQMVPVEPGESVLHVLPLNYSVDNKPGVRPVGMLGRRLEGNFHIVVGRTIEAKKIEQCLQRCGLEVAGIVLEPLASGEAVLTEEEKEIGVALMDIGGGTTDLAFYHEGRVRYTDVVPYGGNNITLDIREGCMLLHAIAEKLKVEHGSTFPDAITNEQIITIPGINGREPIEVSNKQLAGIIEARMSEILSDVNKIKDASGYADKLGAGVVVTGGGALLQHLPQFLNFNMGYGVRIARPLVHLAPNTPAEYRMPQYSTVLGLVQMALNDQQHGMVLEREAEAPAAQQPMVEEVAVVEEAAPRPQRKNMLSKLKEMFSSAQKAINSGADNFFGDDDTM